MAGNSLAGEEWRAHWPTVVAAMAGFSMVSVATTSMSLFVEPLASEFGWSRATVTAGLLIFAAVGVPLSPFAGALVDRWGARAIAIPGILLSTACFSAFSLANGSAVQWFGLWTLYSLAEVTIKSYVWATAVSNLFTASRGLAVAVTLCGVAVTQTLSPLIAQFLIDTYGWRYAYVWMGLGWGLTALVLVLLFFDDGTRAKRRNVSLKDLPAKPQQLSGLTFGQAMKDRSIQIIVLVTVLQTSLISAVSIHKVPILSEIGLSREYGAIMASLAGIGAILGKLVTGYFLDRSESLWTGRSILALPSISFLLLLPAQADDYLLIIASMAIIGFSSGASLQTITYWTSRFAGLRSFGKTYGMMTSGMALATGLAPVLTGASFDRFGSYSVFIMSAVPIGLVSALLTLGLKPYPVWVESKSGL